MSIVKWVVSYTLRAGIGLFRRAPLPDGVKPPGSLVGRVRCRLLHRKHYRPYLHMGTVAIFWCQKCDRPRAQLW